METRILVLVAVAALAGQISALPNNTTRTNKRPQRQNNNAIDANKKPQTVTDLFITGSCVDKPYTCPHPRIKFYLYTRETQNDPDLIDVNDPMSLVASHFNVKNPTKVVIHGFGGGRNLSPSPDMREAYFIRGEYNIIIVDYGTLVKEPCLSQIGWGPRFCARCIAQLLYYLDQVSGTPPDSLHLVGYSVGAHIAGLAANYINFGKIGRITGLDPSVVFYQGSNSSRDLDASDAHFVDIIHTGAGILGQWGPNGHADFYVNGGTSQPGCGGTIFQTLSCDHTKVTPYFIESIITEKGFYASRCANFFSYLFGLCESKDSDYILMGEDCPHSARGEYYLTTNANPPFAQGFPNTQKNREAAIERRKQAAQKAAQKAAQNRTKRRGSQQRDQNYRRVGK
ncbi:pancreatic lipase-related protein 2-like [Neocloeon triangulifer]|uniref:pancreatic lipase-related protein 2-like n=1 Tax=Neocloeon triangulifer TaxID=2078957 RepID=UPI00286F561A|nr:pancreatic lipase-related protein 2-like [Neocloeon triangulifer]